METETGGLPLHDLQETWSWLTADDRREGFALLGRPDAEEFFLGLSARDQAPVLFGLPPGERRGFARLLAPDDAAELLRWLDAPQRATLLDLLDEPTRKEVSALLAYAEDAAGGLMNPRYARVRPEMTVDEAISYLRRQSREQLETIYYAYVLDNDQKLLGVTSFRDLFKSQPQRPIREVMKTQLITIPEHLDQEELGRMFQRAGLLALPVVDAEGRMKGVVTVDDVVGVVAQEATEDIQKMGGSESLGEPYLAIRFRDMIKKRAGWLAALFLGEMLTATAMGFFEHEIAKAVVLALFVPLIISSGGNSGSQATTLVIRAMALGEVRLRDWWRVMRREIGSGLALGSILAVIGFTRILVWQMAAKVYGEHWMKVALTVAFSLVGVVTFGTLTGSLLPFILRRLGFDPASASAPVVATMLDLSGVLIYFTLAQELLRGRLL